VYWSLVIEPNFICLLQSATKVLGHFAFSFYCLYCSRTQIARLRPLISVGMQSSDSGKNYNIEMGIARGLEYHITSIMIRDSKFVIWQCVRWEPSQKLLSLIVAWKKEMFLYFMDECPFATFPYKRVLSITSALCTKLICVFLNVIHKQATCSQFGTQIAS